MGSVFKQWNMTNNKNTATNNNQTMINPLCSVLADSRLRKPGNGQHGNGSDQNQNKLPKAGKVDTVVDANSTIQNTKPKGLHKRFHFAKNFLHLKSSKSVAKSAKHSEYVENGNLTREFSKSDENLIRIQVPLSEVDSEYRESCVSRVLVEYNPSNDPPDSDYEDIGARGYNEKAVDVPEDFVRNQWMCRRQWKAGNICNKYPESIRSFQREDWINTQTAQNTTCRHHIELSQNYDLTENLFIDRSFKSQNTPRQMGAGCSAGCLSKSVGPYTPTVTCTSAPKKLQDTQVKTPPRLVLEAKCNSYSNLRQLQLFDSPCQGSGSIQEDNILHRRNYAYSPNHYSSLLDLPTSAAKSKSKTSSRPTASDSQSIRHTEYDIGGGGGFFKNFSGSVQNLVQFGREKGRVKSASENNLAKIPLEKLNRKTNSVLFDAEIGRIDTQEKDTKPRRTLKRFFELNLPKIKRNKDRRKM